MDVGGKSDGERERKGQVAWSEGTSQSTHHCCHTVCPPYAPFSQRLFVTYTSVHPPRPPPLPHRYTTSLPSNPPSIWASHVRANPSLVPLPYIFNGRWHPPQFFWPPAIPFATIIFVHQSPIRPLACVLSSRSSLCLSPAMFTHCDQYSDCRTCRFT